MKMRPVGAALFHTDRRADGQRNTTKLQVASQCLQMSLALSGFTLVECLVPLCFVALRRIVYRGAGRVRRDILGNQSKIIRREVMRYEFLVKEFSSYEQFSKNA
jgi:hypothetical protein